MACAARWLVYIADMPAVHQKAKKLSDNEHNVISDKDKSLKSFDLALSYALSIGVQEDVAKALRVRQSDVSRWSRGAVRPQPRRRPALIAKLASFVSRRSRKVAR